MNLDNIKNIFSNFRDKQFRSGQEEGIEYILNSTKPVTVLRAPTGFGKSLVGVCAGALFHSFTYLVSSKPLQNQLHHDYPEIPMLKGRNNYKCLNSGYACDLCTHSKASPCDFKLSDCEYEKNKRKVLASKYKLLNYHYFLTEANNVGRFSKASEILICDEGDMLENLLLSFVSLKISPRLLKHLNIPKPQYKTAESKHGIESWKRWAELTGYIVEGKIRQTIQELGFHRSNNDEENVQKINRELTAYNNLKSKLDIFIEHVDASWVFEDKYNGYVFKPVWMPRELTRMFLTRHASRIALVSATFPPLQVLSECLGIPVGDFDYREMKGVFRPENRKVVIFKKKLPNLTKKTFAKESIITTKIVRYILKKHPEEKGIIHTVSYKLADLIIKELADPRFLTHNNRNREEVVEMFKEFKAPVVLISPSLERGIDLPQEECRFIIWAKAPFLSLGDKSVGKRLYTGGKNGIGSLWYRSNAAQSIEQGCGRGVRSSSDYCITYIIDDQIKRMIVESPLLFSRYFLEAVEFE